MKKFILCGLVFGASLSSAMTYADDDIKLKKSCLKDYPEVVGETDASLLQVYAQLCDKKNKDNKNSNLVAAAQKFQQLGKNNKALSIVNYLEAQNIQSNELTDVKFLSSIGLAYDALNKMRKTEMRYLSEDLTYPVAKNFNEALKEATPSSVLVEKQQVVSSSSKSVTTNQKHKKRSVNQTRTSTTGRKPPVVNAKPPKVVEQPSKPKPNPPASGKNPFGQL